MKITFVVFWINLQRELYGDNSYYVLGEWMGSFNTHNEAVEYIKTLKLGKDQNCTIMQIYGGK